MKQKEQVKTMTIDLRDIEDEFYHPFGGYSWEDVELFKNPTQLKHFKGRIDALINRRNKNMLALLPKGEGDFFLCLKLYVLNLIPTLNTELTHQIYVYLYDKLGAEELQMIVNNYANYLERFK